MAILELRNTLRQRITLGPKLPFNPLVYRQIRLEPEFEAFDAIYYQKSRLHAPLAYQAQGQTLIFYRYRQPAVWCGGVVVNTKAEFRNFSSFSVEKTQHLLRQNQLKTNDLVEISCLWMRTHQLSRMDKLWIYCLIFYKTLRTGKSCIMASSIHPKLQAIQQQVLDQPLHQEPSGFQGQLVVDRYYYAKRTRFVLNICKVVPQNIWSCVTQPLTAKRPAFVTHRSRV